MNKFLNIIQILNSLILAVSLTDMLNFLALVLTIIQIFLIVFNFVLKMKNSSKEEKKQLIDNTLEQIEDIKEEIKND